MEVNVFVTNVAVNQYQSFYARDFKIQFKLHDSNRRQVQCQ